MQRLMFLIIITVLRIGTIYSQMIPGELQNIEYLVTFGKDSKVKYGDSDFSQVIYFVISKTTQDTFHLRIYDPDISGKNDINVGGFNSITRYELYGGEETYWDGHKDKIDLDTKSTLLFESEFDSSCKHDNEWHTLCSLPVDGGEFIEEFDVYIFKFISKGLSGDDGNCYQLYLSSSKDENVKFDYANSFTYKITCKLESQPNVINHIFPYIDKYYDKLEIGIFGWNQSGMININSWVQEDIMYKITTRGWNLFDYPLVEEEEFTSLNICFSNKQSIDTMNQILTYRLIGDNSKYLHIFSDPIGGLPKWNPEIRMINND